MSVVTATILSSGKPINATYDLVSIDITHLANRIPYAQLVLIDGDAAQQRFEISDSDTFQLGKQIEIKLRYENAPDQQASVFQGLVVAQRVEANAQGSLLTIELKDTTMKLTLARKSAVFYNQSDDQIIGKILQQQQIAHGTIPKTQPTHAQLVQYQCSDWDFILARAEANGLLVTIDNGKVTMPKIAIQGQPTHTFEYGLSDILDFEMEADAESQYAEVQSVAWDAKNQQPTSMIKAKNFSLAQSNLNAKTIAQAIGAETIILKHPVPADPKELQAWADGRLARSRLAMLRGRIAVPGFGDIKLMDVLQVAGIGKRFNGKTLVTGLRHRVDHDGWRTDVQFGLAAERFTERPDIVDLPAAGLLPAIHGLQIGVVDAFEDDPAKEFRVKVILPGIDQQQGAIWARLASPDAGNGRGSFFRPEPHDEVVVGFFNDDPRQAVILGAMYGSKNQPPKGMAELTKENKNKAIVTKKGTTIGFVDDEKSSVFIQTPASNKILFDDDAQAIRISDQHGNTITMNKDGIVIKSAKDVKIEASGNVEIKGQKVDLK
jgi:Rhs element Vgr protein